MSTNYRGRTVAALCGLAVVAGGVIGHSLLPRDIASADPVEVGPKPSATAKPSVPAKDPFAPSRAWLHAGPEQRVEAYAGFVAEVNANQTCMRDVQHSYLGLFLTPKGEHGDVPSKLHPGQDHHFSKYVPGVCDEDPNADWSTVDPLFAEALAQDATIKGHDEAYFAECLYLEGDTTWIACPDGYWTSS